MSCERHLTEIDEQLINLVARRQALSENVASVKRATGRATRDFGREREVILRGRTTAERLGVSPDLAESLLRQLIQSSLATKNMRASRLTRTARENAHW